MENFVSYRKIFLLFIISIVLACNCTNGTGAMPSTRGYHFQLVHRHSLIPSPDILQHSLINPAQRNPRFAVPRVSGDFQANIWAKNHLFLVNMSFGVPPVPQLVAMDTASSQLWVECDPCTSCSTKPSTRFKRKKSSTFSSISCSSPLCNYLRSWQCDNQSHCVYDLSYDDGTHVRGTLANDKITFKTSHNGIDDVRDIIFGCTYDHHGGSGLYPIGGVLGHSFSPLSLIRQLGVTRFSYCISSVRDPYYSHNQLLLGDTANTKGYLTPLEIYHDRYYVTLEGISVGEKMLEIEKKIFDRTSDGGGGIMVSSGTPQSYLVAQAFEALSSEIDQHVKKLYPSISQLKDSEGLVCYRGILDHDIHEFPMVGFHFAGGANLLLGIDSIFDQSTNESYCMAFGRAGQNEISVIGMKAQQYHNIGYDLATIQLSIRRIDCELLQD